MTPCEELGYAVGDKFIVLSNTVFNEGQIVTLYEDDGSASPLFSGEGVWNNCDGKPGAYLPLGQVAPYKPTLYAVSNISEEAATKFPYTPRTGTITPSGEFVSEFGEVFKYAVDLDELAMMPDPTEDLFGIDAVLKERGDRYGSFVGHALIAQNIKAAMKDSANWDTLPKEMKESLEMVAHKIGRILNGDPTYKDSWHDIVGYVKLIDDTLED